MVEARRLRGVRAAPINCSPTIVESEGKSDCWTTNKIGGDAQNAVACLGAMYRDVADLYDERVRYVLIRNVIHLCWT